MRSTHIPFRSPLSRRQRWVVTQIVEKAKEMQAALESNEASTELLKRRLAELRAAKKQVKEEMTRAQEELRQICTVRQETVLVLMGLLE